MLFSNDEWDVITKKYTKQQRFRKKNNMENKLKDINKLLGVLHVRTWVRLMNLHMQAMPTSLKFIEKERQYSIRTKPTAQKEYDAFAKIWSEIFEDAFGKKNRILKWGESICENTKDQMDKAGINKKVKGYKVDCRVLTLIEEKEHDLLNCEASRSLTQQKVLDDKLKLLLETKCNLDHLTLACPNANPTISA